jgi:hypothetical protein
MCGIVQAEPPAKAADVFAETKNFGVQLPQLSNPSFANPLISHFKFLC